VNSYRGPARSLLKKARELVCEVSE
jgi:hypothetical protein